ncbi:hypothetical protein [Nocardioides sp. TF02-7]|uniref:hypothetical protein n=1 Tax=Nocardioides sp. TF02-7 TaxID=2917724 RepID=UPI001F063998|nr:hypothetical protein [Nocardioides sp. TF02-7]UMG93309.1 hypothetical protein MF408_03240 [Nocardioides sp. TF02-7]
MSAEVAARVKDRFDNLSNEFDETAPLFGAQVSHLESACGEFSDEVATGCDTMRIGWRTVLETGTTSAGLIAGNTNALHVDLTAIDQDYSWQFDLSGTSTAAPPRNRGMY